jgi:hypothetical protein
MSADRSKNIAPLPRKKGDDPTSAQGVISTKAEEKHVQERVAIGANVVYETIRREGEEELKRPNAALAWSAVAAGLSMGISVIAQALLKAHLPKPASGSVSIARWVLRRLPRSYSRASPAVHREDSHGDLAAYGAQRSKDSWSGVAIVGGCALGKLVRNLSVCNLHRKN